MGQQALCSPPYLRRVLGRWVWSWCKAQVANKQLFVWACTLTALEWARQRVQPLFRFSLSSVICPSLLINWVIFFFFWDIFSFPSGYPDPSVAWTPQTTTPAHSSLLCSSNSRSGPYKQHHCQELIRSDLLIALNDCWKEPKKKIASELQLPQ